MFRGFLGRILPRPARQAVKRIARNWGLVPAGPDQAEILLSLQSRLQNDLYPFAKEIFPGVETDFPKSRVDQYGLRLKEFLATQETPWSEELPVSAAFYRDLSKLYNECDKVEGNIAHAMKRLAYKIIPYSRCQSGKHFSNTKNALPLVGLLPTLRSNRQFVADALNGHARVEELIPDKIVSDYWSNQPHYYPVLKDMVSESLSCLSKTFIDIFSNREQLVDLVTHELQLELAFGDLMRNDDWKLVIAGDAGMSLPLTLFDLGDDIRPPVAYFEHGLVYGDPYHSMLARADYFLVHGTRDREIWNRLGISLNRMVTVGCLTQDHFPSRAYCEEQRRMARLRHGLDDSQKAILYGMDWQADLILRPSTAQTQSLVINSLAILAQNHGVKPVLFLKYHPSPGDPFFYKSRVDYPLPEFLKLEEYGIEVRLAPDLESYLPLADCYLAHESTTLGDAIGAATATYSLDYNPTGCRPILDHVAYKEGETHRYLSLRHSPQAVAQGFAEILSFNRESIYPSCKRVFDNLYDCGRTRGLSTFGKFFQELAERGK